MMSEMKSQDEYESYATGLLDRMQDLHSIQSMCSVIRMGKEIAHSKPSSIRKEFDDTTGDVMYNGVIITRDHWSTAITRTVHRFKELLSSLIECHLLEDVLNPNNKMVLAGPEDTTVTVLDEAGKELRVINVAESIIPKFAGENVQATIDELFSLEQGTYLYLSGGAGRGEEIKRLSSFQSAFQLVFNHLHFQMKSSKAVNHGVDPNDWVDHYVPASLSRLIVVLNLCVYREIQSSTNNNLRVPLQEEAKAAARDMFRKIFGVTSTNTKEFREFCILIVNYIAPSSLAKTSTTAEFASQFHHKISIHNSNYASTTFRRTNDGEFIRGPLLLARQYHEALGEPQWNFEAVADINEDTIPSQSYHEALKRGLRLPSARCNAHQMQACELLGDYSNNTNAFVFRPTGSGKSFMWNGLLLSRFLRGSKRKKFIVLSPHSALLALHVIQSKDFFHGTSLKVVSLTAADLDSVSTIGDFDLCYISIHAFAILRDSKADLLESWEVGTIYIDECHLLFCELFRIGTSWNSLRDIVALGTKLVALSATLNKFAIKIIANYMGIEENYQVIGDENSYDLPDVSIHVKTVSHHSLLSFVEKQILKRFESNPSNFAIHVITKTKDQAMTISSNLAKQGLTTNWLTGDDTAPSRTNKMQEWADGKLQVLVSTMNCGFDCGICKEVFVVDEVRSIADAIQSIGRIRPKQQKKSHVTFVFTEKSYLRWDETSKRYLPYETWSDSEWNDIVRTMTDNHLFDGLDDEEKIVAKSHIRSLFFAGRARSVFLTKGNTTCLRTALFKSIGVNSRASCGLCSVCTKKSSVGNTVVAAKQRETEREEDVRMVNEVVKSLRIKCFACGNSTCSGLDCVMVPTKTRNNPKLAIYKQHWCNVCFGTTLGKGAFHTSNRTRVSNKIPLCKAAQIPESADMCHHCFMLLDKSIEARGKKEDHNNGHGNCVYKLRIRRILLHQTLRQTDAGLSSKQVLARVVNNKQLWYELMANNIKQIKSQKSN